MYPTITSDMLELQDELRTMYAKAIQSNLFEHTPYEGGAIGVSQLGKPAICTAWDYHNGKTHLNNGTWAQRRKWLGGHVFELWVFYLLRRAGYEVEHQAVVSVDQNISRGHPDFVVKDGDATYVVECKHVGDSTYKQFAKHGMTNAQYVTQLALYCKALDASGCWVIGNTDTGECMCIPFGPLEIAAAKQYVERAQTIAAIVKSCESFEACLEYIGLPPYKTTKDNRHYPPPTMYAAKGMLHPAASLWNIELTPEGKHSIVGYNYPNQCKQFEPEWEG